MKKTAKIIVTILREMVSSAVLVFITALLWAAITMAGLITIVIAIPAEALRDTINNGDSFAINVVNNISEMLECVKESLNSIIR